MTRQRFSIATFNAKNLAGAEVDNYQWPDDIGINFRTIAYHVCLQKVFYLAAVVDRHAARLAVDLCAEVTGSIAKVPLKPKRVMPSPTTPSLTVPLWKMTLLVAAN